jgi:hypothetical protein
VTTALRIAFQFRSQVIESQTDTPAAVAVASFDRLTPAAHRNEKRRMDGRIGAARALSMRLMDTRRLFRNAM